MRNPCDVARVDIRRRRCRIKRRERVAVRYECGARQNSLFRWHANAAVDTNGLGVHITVRDAFHHH